MFLSHTITSLAHKCRHFLLELANLIAMHICALKIPFQLKLTTIIPPISEMLC